MYLRMAFAVLNVKSIMISVWLGHYEYNKGCLVCQMVWTKYVAIVIDLVIRIRT